MTNQYTSLRESQEATEYEYMLDYEKGAQDGKSQDEESNNLQKYMLMDYFDERKNLFLQEAH